VKELRELGLNPLDVVMDDVWDDIATIYRRSDIPHARKTTAALAIYDNAWRHPTLNGQPKLALVVKELLQGVKLLVAGVGPEAHKAGLEKIARFSPDDLLGARRYVVEKLVKDKATRRHMIELTRHLTERQAAQVLPLSARTIGRARLEDDAKMETETATPTVVERLTALEALVPRVEELERQVGVLPPERVEEEVERLLDQVLD
jgi:hypothetical protein